MLDWLAPLQSDAELIFVDGGSADGTRTLLENAGCHVIVSPPGRGTQLAEGARSAEGTILWFLHADTRPPRNALEAIRNALRNPNVAAGNFHLIFEGKRWPSRFMTWFAARLKWLGIAYGDSAIFVRRTVYEQSGGFKALPLFEDLDLLVRVKKAGRMVTLKSSVRTAGRRYERRNFACVFFEWCSLQVLYWLGVPPRTLARIYYPGRNFGSTVEASSCPDDPPKCENKGHVKTRDGSTVIPPRRTASRNDPVRLRPGNLDVQRSRRTRGVAIPRRPGPGRPHLRSRPRLDRGLATRTLANGVTTSYTANDINSYDAVTEDGNAANSDRLALSRAGIAHSTDTLATGASPEKSPAICCDLREAGWSGVGLGLRCGRYVLIQPFHNPAPALLQPASRCVSLRSW